ncbi:MAG TPA: nitrous oxide-stimulated promoter family protein [Anaerolineae bacterium]|nr:nitrous oxide-stimulated promoter family protein [Anaerolineae bacterium]HCC78322.1 nitrous oxide-stimulated promoter family protein [Anaerolineae bacterium]HCM97699.1 nitrous oxide-stimulated promoter family protein [Anaerolineae bacterium]
MFTKNRLERESQTLQAMFLLYCQRHHGCQSKLCKQCQELQDYSLNRLKHCPFQQGKTTCAKCPIHCYKSEMRSRIKQIMRFSGPRMLLTHPILTIQHYLDSLRKEPQEL